MKVTEDSIKKPEVSKEAAPVVAKEPKEVKDADTLTFEGIFCYTIHLVAGLMLSA